MHEKIIQEITTQATSINAHVGLYALHLESKTEVCLHADERFPLASIDKIAIAACCLGLAEKGDLSLQQLISIEETDLRPGTGLLNKRFDIPGVAMSGENLIRLLLELSDNTANDKLLRMIGGPGAVTAWLKKNDIDDINIDRSCLRGLADQIGLRNIPDDERCTLQQFEAMENTIDNETKRRFEENYLLDSKDTATPAAVGKLLKNIFTHQIISRKSAEFMFACMRRCQTGRMRIRAGFSADANVKVAHKTGTMFGITNDVGIIELPNNRGNLILVIFVKSTATTLQEQEKLIADTVKIIEKFI